jgi:hypothetical protein
MRYLTSTIVVLTLLTGCGGKKKDADVDPKTGLTSKQYDQMKTINESFTNIDSAISVASKGTNSTNEKVSKLADMLKANGCREEGKPEPTESYTSNWKAAYSLGAGGCPLKITKDWDYNGNNTRRTWVYRHNVETQFGDFRDTSEIESFAVQHADLIVNNQSGGNQTVTGNYQYSNFVVRDIGLLTASLRTDQRYTVGRSGGGTVTFRLNSRKDLKVKLDVTFRSGRPTSYRINGYDVQPDVVNELFSSFGIMQVKARSEKMLY